LCNIYVAVFVFYCLLRKIKTLIISKSLGLIIPPISKGGSLILKIKIIIISCITGNNPKDYNNNNLLQRGRAINMKTDISTRKDVELLVNTFYDAVKQSPVIGYIFDDVVKVDWDEHLPKMYSFWASVLLDEHSYSGNPMLKHIEISRMTAMTEKEFSEWIRLFNDTVDILFEGANAQTAKVRAANIARLMLYKIETAGNSLSIIRKEKE